MERKNTNVLQFFFFVSVIFVIFAIVSLIIGSLRYLDIPGIAGEVMIDGLDLILYSIIGISYSIPVSYYIHARLNMLKNKN